MRVFRMRVFRCVSSCSYAVICSWVALIALLTHPASAERRVAFVVGNGAYQHTTTLPNPPLDAKAMAALLRNVGFDVVEGVDLDRAGMTARLSEFAVKTQGADVALLFYAGHGIAVNGKNYLLPVDANLNSEFDVKFGAAIDLDATLDQTMADAKVKLVFLDACRDNPFADKIRSASRTRSVTVLSGLAEMKSSEGTLVAFATGPGQKAIDGRQGENSPFTHALLQNLAEPGVEIRLALTKVRAQVSEETHKQQLPWENTNLTGFFYLNPAAAPAATASAAGTAPAGQRPGALPPSPSSEIELEFWRSAQSSGKSEEYSAYLTRYPNGNFATIARARLAALETEAATRAAQAQSIHTALATRETEEQLALDPHKRSDIQRRLSALGYLQGNADGNFNDNTRHAIERWQTARHYPRSGYFNKLQHDALLAERLPAVRTAAPAAPRPQHQAPAAQQAPPAQQQVPAAQQPAVDPAGAAFMGGIVGGAIGNAIRGR
ncbi:MAG TPA: caspase family protein [Xanthobacteraceae bacterium]|nr:caspase family protein [Xanthobacteraceae bacterium]